MTSFPSAAYSSGLLIYHLFAKARAFLLLKTFDIHLKFLMGSPEDVVELSRPTASYEDKYGGKHDTKIIGNAAPREAMEIQKPSLFTKNMFLVYFTRFQASRDYAN